MNALFALIKRNIKLFFKDKGMFFSSLITPAILLVLYATFLGNVYKETFTANLPEGFLLSESVINGLVGSTAYFVNSRGFVRYGRFLLKFPDGSG